MNAVTKTNEEIEGFLNTFTEKITISDKKPQKNVYIINTPFGQQKIKSDLNYDEFIESLKGKKIFRVKR